MSQATTADATPRVHDGRTGTGAVLAYSAVLGLLALVGATRFSGLEVPEFEVAPLIIVTMLVLTERVLILHVTIREENHVFTFSEIPLCLGLFAMAPTTLLACCLAGVAIAVVLQRSEWVKLVFNLAQGALQIVLAVLVFHAIAGPGLEPTDLRTWLAATVAVVVSDACSALMVIGAMWFYRGIFDRNAVPSMLAFGALASFTKTCVGMLAVVLLYEGLGPATAMLAVVVVTTVLAFRWAAALHERYRRLELLYGFTRVVGRSVQTERIIAGALEGARELLNADRAELVIDDGVGWVVRWRLSGNDELTRERQPADARAELWAHVVATGESVLAPDGGKAEWAATREELDLVDFVASPLHGDRGICGLLLVGNRRDDITTFEDDDRKLFEVLANHTSVALQNGRLVEELQREAEERAHRASHDGLTGLVNRTRFLELVDEALDEPARAGTVTPVLLLGLDHFKEVNDTLGHSNGDRVLQEVGYRLVEALRDRGTVARVSGDEFAVLLRDAHDADEARRFGEQLTEIVGQPIHVSGLALGVGSSIGLAVAPDHGDDAATLLQRADVAMYLAKSRHSGFELYEAAGDPHSPRRLALAYQLRQALDRQELILHYQPKMDLRTRRVVGVEALVRWVHPELGFLPPDEFIPVAERTGLIGPLTTYVLDEALAQRRRWAEGGLALGIAVNVSARSLSDPWLPEKIAVALNRAGCPAEALTIEVTESQLMADPQRAAGALERITELGVTVSIDDFGTGFSSLSSLRALPVGEIKIDKSFVLHLDEDDNDAVIVRSTADLGRNLGLRVVAEGVENEASLSMLTEFGVDIAQGYLLSRPLAAPDFERWLAGDRADSRSAA